MRARGGFEDKETFLDRAGWLHEPASSGSDTEKDPRNLKLDKSPSTVGDEHTVPALANDV